METASPNPPAVSLPGYDALRATAAWLDLSARGKIIVTGEDRARLQFGHGLGLERCRASGLLFTLCHSDLFCDSGRFNRLLFGNR